MHHSPTYTATEIIIFICTADINEMLVLGELLDEEKYLYPLNDLKTIWQLFQMRCDFLKMQINILK